ncbi:MAG: hypothetical protein H6822_19665 [Planctomycetaceae bacterium]|nr:hypothetical protein [Planctomycetaceae bacterium]
MKFDAKFPDAHPGIPPIPNVVKSLYEHQERPCRVCEEPTRWFHRELIIHVCSEECINKFLQQN